ncbi:MAG: PIN domain-containing protein [Natrialbaceae archaeon]|nr:PIN domain-containing protein [Natrialbaceae archaeon]
MHHHGPRSICLCRSSLSELQTHRPTIQSKTGLGESELDVFIQILFEEIDIVPREEFESSLAEARDILTDIDPDDVPFLALAIDRGLDIWSDDGHFHDLSMVSAWTSTELFDHLDLL